MSETPAYDQAWAYPSYVKPFREYWGGRFEDIFVWFHPFFSVEGVDPLRDGYCVSQFGTGDAAEKAYKSAINALSSEVEVLEGGTPSNKAEATIIGGATLISSLDYPDLSKFDLGAIKLHRWSSIAGHCGWKDLNERGVLIALLASMGETQTIDCSVGMARSLVQACEKYRIFLPMEGLFPELCLYDLESLLQAAGSENVFVQPDFDIDPTKKIKTDSLGISDLPAHSNLYLTDPELLITVDCDSHFTLVAGPHDLITPWVSRNSLDGFFASPEIRHDWWSQDIKQNQITARTLT